MSPMDQANQARIDDITRVEARLRDLDHNLRRVMTHLGLAWEDAPAPTGAPPGVMEALADGNAIAAIKAYRQATGVGLAEAQEAVDRLRTGG